MLKLSNQFPSNLIDKIDISIQKEAGAKRVVDVQMSIPHSIEQVWQVITGYATLAELIPNLARCRQVNQTETSKHLEFIGTCHIFNLRISMRLVLDVVESFPYQIDTQLIEGDLLSYSGQWHLQQNHDGSTLLSYRAEIVPKPGLPIALLERQIQHLLPINFLAIRQHLDQISQSNLLTA